MNKSISFVAIALVFLLGASAFASAWHCVDTDQQKPKAGRTGKYGPWGNDGFLGGTTTGWSNQGVTPPGCTGSQGDWTCEDACDGTTLREYYCTDRQGHTGETIISWKVTENSDQCGNEVPEFTPLAAGAATVTVLGGLLIMRRKQN